MSHPDPEVSTGTPLVLSVLGTGFAVHATEPALAAELRRLLAPFVLNRPPRGELRVGRAPAGTAVPAGPIPVQVALQTVLTEVNTAALAAAGYLAVHAGVVARGQAAVAFPAPSGTGKSSLTAACLRAGLDYVSDEALCLEWAGGGVVGYPRPLALSPWSAREVGIAVPADIADGTGEVLLTAADLGAAVATGPLALAHIVLPRREPGAAATLTPLPRGEAVGELLTRSFTSWHRPERAFALVHEVVAAAQTWRLTLGRPADAAALIADLLPTT